MSLQRIYNSTHHMVVYVIKCAFQTAYSFGADASIIYHFPSYKISDSLLRAANVQCIRNAESANYQKQLEESISLSKITMIILQNPFILFYYIYQFYLPPGIFTLLLNSLCVNFFSNAFKFSISSYIFLRSSRCCYRYSIIL